MKKIGLRNIKTAVAVVICLSLYLLLILIFKAFDYQVTNNGATLSGWAAAIKISTQCYTPFFACIATAYSMSTDKGKSLKQAKLRIIASLIGGLFGVLIVWLYICITKNEWSFQFISATGNATGGFKPGDFTGDYILSFIVPIILTGIATIVVIWLCNMLKQKDASFAAVLTLTAVMTSLGTDAIIYGFNRIASTIIGVVVALGVNLFHIPHFNKNDDLLFCVGIEGIIKHDKDSLAGFANYKLNSLYDKGANCTLFTTRTPTTFMHLFQNSKINHPVICCSGAALYNTSKLTYVYKEEIAYDVSVKIDEYLDKLKVTPFKNYIIDDVLHTYCKSIDNIGEKLYAESKKNAAYCSFDIGQVNDKLNVLYYLIVENIETTNKIVNELENGPLNDDVFVQVYDYFENSEVVPELKYVKIYSRKILELNVLKKYCEEKKLRSVGLTTTEMSNHLLNNCDISVTYHTNESMKDKVDIILNTDSYDEMFKTISKIYYSKKYHLEKRIANE